MKKVFTIMIALLAMAFVSKAQTLLSEGFEGGTIPTGWTLIDNDGDANEWYAISQADFAEYAHTGMGLVTSASWTQTAGPLTPDNWLVTPALTLTANANLTFWVDGQDASWPAENYSVYVATSNTVSAFLATTPVLTGVATATWEQKTVDLSAYTGQTVYIAFRHHNTTDMFRINLDDIEVSAIPTSPTINATPTDLTYSATRVGSTANQIVSVTAYLLSSDITATTAAPFAVSADGTTWSTTASLPTNGGTLYVQYAPTAAGTDNGTVDLTSGSATASIALTGSAFDCSIATIPYFTDFTTSLNDCWTIIDANGDGNGSNGQFSFDPENGVAEYYYNSESAADDWLISPTFTLTGNEVASFDYSASTYYPERFQVFALGTDTVALTSVITAAGTATQNLDLTTLSGDYQIGIHCISDADELSLDITNFTVEEVSDESSLTVVGDTLNFRIVPMGTNSNNQTFIINTTNFNEDVTISTVAPFEVSLDGTTFDATVTITASTAIFTTDTVYARFAPTTVGTFNEEITISSTTTNNTLVVMGESVDCSEGISTFPYVYDFNTGTYPPTCWTVNDEENFDYVEFTDAEHANALLVSDLDRLVTPEIHSENPLMLSFEHLSYAAATGEAPSASTFRVGYSSTDTDADSFTYLADANVSLNGIGTYTTPIPAGTKYISIDLVSLGTYLFWGFLEVEDNVIFDNFSLIELSEPTMVVSDESLNFGNVMLGNEAVKTTNVMGALLTSPITVNAPANFEVSADGNAYAASATLPADGGMLYVKYNPSAVGSHTGNVTLTSGSLTVNIAVSGAAMDCSVPEELPFFEGFENGLSACWTNLDNDGDGNTWTLTSAIGLTPHAGADAMYSASYNNNTGVLNPDNWLISPQLVIPAEGATITWFVAAQDPNYPADHYELMISTGGAEVADFTSVFEEELTTDAWSERNVDLSSYAGQTIRFAFVHNNCPDNYMMKIDDITVACDVNVDEYDSHVAVYPNPAQSTITISASESIDNIQVINLAGQCVYTMNANDSHLQMNVNDLSNGIYFVKVKTVNGISTSKITIAR